MGKGGGPRAGTRPRPGRPVRRESADKVVLHTGKYEELIVCSHEIAASTAQLVAASKVGEGGLLPACHGWAQTERHTQTPLYR